MKAPHLAALVWIALLALVASVITALVAANISTSGGIFTGPDPDDIAMKVSLNGLSNLLLLTSIIAGLLAIALAGVRHFLNGMLRIQRSEIKAEPKTDPVGLSAQWRVATEPKRD